MKKLFIIFLFLSFIATSFSQHKRTKKLGRVTLDELKMKFYPKDTIAQAVVLEDHGNLYISKEHDYKNRTDFYTRVKLFNKNEFDRATVKILTYGKEKVVRVEAITYNLVDGKQTNTYLEKSNIFTKKLDQNYTSTTFTLPNLKEGCVIEYRYSVISPYNSIDDWYFQQDIPVILSVFDASILGNYKYHISLRGSKKLDIDKTNVEKNCVFVDGIGNGNCMVISFGMKDLKAFKEDAYMLSKENYISKLLFQIESFTQVNGTVIKYTKTWKNAEKVLRKKYFDKQTNRKNFFKKNIPNSLFEEANDLKKAKGIYYFLQKRLNWNNKYWSQNKIKVREVYNTKTGSVTGINLTLFNALKAANIDANLVMIATRNRGIPTKLYPVLKSFNYAIVMVQIDDKKYFLDATEKNLSFGQVPLRCYSGEGRVLNFKDGGSWENITSNIKTSTSVNAKLTFVPNKDVNLQMDIIKTGYNASNTRDEISEIGIEQFTEKFDTKNPDFVVTDFKIKNLEDIDKNITETYKLVLDDDEIVSEKKIILNPFFNFKITRNPFKLNERSYPVDYGYPRKFKFYLKFDIPEGYTLKSFPKKERFLLPNKGGSYLINTSNSNNSFTLFMRYELKKRVYTTQEYFSLKAFFNRIIQSHKQSIVIEQL